ncbi:hypothetical protein JW905_12865 [bacterium]|nr:hypothetical protein [candidate division CSSED10-310 bacterium]
MKVARRMIVWCVDMVPLWLDVPAGVDMIPGVQDPALIAQLEQLNAGRRDGTEDATAARYEAYPVTRTGAYLKSRLRGRKSVLIDRAGRPCRLRWKPVSFFFFKLYYSFLQFLLLPFIRIGIRLRDHAVTWKACYRRLLDILGEGRRRSERRHVTWLRVVRKAALFCYYRLVLVWRKARVLAVVAAYCLLVLPGALLLLIVYYVYLMCRSRLEVT